MLDQLSLYPRITHTRTSVSLDGMWHLRFDPESIGEQEKWMDHMDSSISIPVPSSFADLFTDQYSKNYCGDFWYETDFFVPKTENCRTMLRFGSITHRGTVYVNSVKITEHEGGFLPVIGDITDVVKPGEFNHLAVKANNELNESSLPCGSVKTLQNGTKIAFPYFDFFNYSGIQRSVYLIQIPDEHIQDYSAVSSISGNDADVAYEVITNGEHEVRVCLYDADGNKVAESNGKKGSLHVENAHLWNVRKAYLYNLCIQIVDGEKVIDEYMERYGIRTVEIKGTKILINGNPVYLKGFGKHEDFDIIGRGFNWPLVKRDFECMKWTNANCFRTSHYPYAEEWYQFADEEGFLIIDEVAAVGMMRSTRNFAVAGTGNYTYFFETPTVPALLKNHLLQVEEMIERDKNHASVFAFSLFNEPETTSTYAHDYFSKVFERARELDPQHRPMTGAFEKNSAPEKCQCYMLVDFMCLNRYYGWYISGGPEISDAIYKFHDEMNRWQAKELNVPFVFTEFGTDTLATEHKLPSVMWAQEYQNEYLEENFKVFDTYDFIQGELVWNFADFQTTEGIMRVNGNKKGVFTRERQPKDAAFTFKKRWENK
ncbi:MAG: beta-glucuronidase [Erysipelotrichaceae bacterium]|nr:beta-glucuronidase [Erysipelotrichaceae bacterium]MBR2600134.1 beta-glucuronidase [Erysipelotrichaceae bacterium]